MSDSIKDFCQAIVPEAIQWRHHLHENPELGFEEFETTKFIEEKLLSFGNIEIWKPTPTGVVGILKGHKPGKTIAFRSDIDALPIEESPDNPIRSKNSGVMHACGHDAHTATLLGAASVLSQLQEQIEGEIRFIFQPAEELPPGGASQMVAAGVVKDVDFIFALHCHVPEDPGKFIVIPGPMFASTYSFDIEIKGQESHAAFPFQGVDSIVVASTLITTLNGMIPRFIDNAQRSVLTFTKIHGGNSYNVIPDTVSLGGTIRLLDRRAEKTLLERMQIMCDHVCAMYDATCKVTLDKGYDMVENDPNIAQAVRTVLEKYFGAENVLTMTPLMGGEDFSAYLKEVPGCYFRIGTRKVKKDGTVCAPHKSCYEFNDDALSYSIESVVRVLLEAKDYLSE